MRNRISWIVTLSLMTGLAGGQTYEMRSAGGKTYGPFAFKDGKRITIDNRTFKLRELDDKKDKLLKKLQETILPEVNYREATLPDILNDLQAASGTHSKDRKEIMMILKLGDARPNGPEAKTPPPEPVHDPFAFTETKPRPKPPKPLGPATTPITFSARRVPLMTVLKMVTATVGLKPQLTDGMVVVVDANAPDSPIIIRTYNVLPGIYESLGASVYATGEQDSDNAGSDWIVRGTSMSLEHSFAALGVQWPRGSSLRHVPSIGRLIVANTAENLAHFEAILGELNVQPFQIEITAQFVEYSLKDIDNLARKGRVGQKELTTLWEKGKGKLLAAPKLLAESGVEASVLGIREVRYPSEITEAHERIVTNGTAFATNTVRITRPTIATKDIGATFHVLPEVSPERTMISLTMVPKYVDDPTWKTYSSRYVDDNGKERVVTIEQPFFPIRSVSTSVSIYDGERILIGGGVPGKHKDTVIYTFVGARLVDPSGKPLKKPDQWK